MLTAQEVTAGVSRRAMAIHKANGNGNGHPPAEKPTTPPEPERLSVIRRWNRDVDIITHVNAWNFEIRDVSTYERLPKATYLYLNRIEMEALRNAISKALADYPCVQETEP